MSVTKFTEDHEWVRVDGDVATVGITEYAAEQLGDVVFVELPENGRQVGKKDELAVVESVKAASEIYAPVTGEVIEVNVAVEEEPGKVNEDAQGEGWFVKLKVINASELDALMDGDAYKKFVEGQG